MFNLKHLASAFCLFVVSQISYSQLGLSHEIGVILGSTQLRSDYGSRNNTKTNMKNSGFSIGINHYIGFSYRDGYNILKTGTYFNDHFKIRNEISWNKTKLEHYGEWVDPSKNSVEANQLRGHTGVSKNLDIGTQLEFFPLSIRGFQSFTPRLAPFVSLGVHYTFFSPEVTTTFANTDPNAIGNILNPTNFYSRWAPGSVDASPGSTWSVVSSVGVRYKLNKMSDIMLDLRGQYYFSDWIDGLNHQLSYNKFNDWLVWVNVGYIYYLD